MSTEPATSALVQAVCNVMAAVRYVEKTGHNQHSRYSYASDADLLRKLQPAMAAEGLSLRQQSVTHSYTDRTVDVLVTYELAHVSGESRQLQAIGAGPWRDKNPDKAIYAAMTGALKYALRTTFLVPTGDNPDQHTDDLPDTAAGKAVKDASTHPSWAGAKGWYFARIKELGLVHEHVKRTCEAIGKPLPRYMTSEERGGLLNWLATDKGRERYKAVAATPLTGRAK